MKCGIFVNRVDSVLSRQADIWQQAFVAKGDSCRVLEIRDVICSQSSDMLIYRGEHNMEMLDMGRDFDFVWLMSFNSTLWDTLISRGVPMFNTRAGALKMLYRYRLRKAVEELCLNDIICRPIWTFEVMQGQYSDYDKFRKLYMSNESILKNMAPDLDYPIQTVEYFWSEHLPTIIHHEDALASFIWNRRLEWKSTYQAFESVHSVVPMCHVAVFSGNVSGACIGAQGQLARFTANEWLSDICKRVADVVAPHGCTLHWTSLGGTFQSGKLCFEGASNFPDLRCLGKRSQPIFVNHVVDKLEKDFN